MRRFATVPVEELRKALRYEPETGHLIGLIGSPRRLRGARAGHICKHSGYRHVHVCGKELRSNRIAWVLMTGEWPTILVDHKDRDRANDIWLNLRLATESQNRANSKCKSQFGMKGVVPPTKGQRGWRSQISINGKTKFLGRYATIEEAAAAYANAAAEAFGEFARPVG